MVAGLKWRSREGRVLSSWVHVSRGGFPAENRGSYHGTYSKKSNSCCRVQGSGIPHRSAVCQPCALLSSIVFSCSTSLGGSCRLSKYIHKPYEPCSSSSYLPILNCLLSFPDPPGSLSAIRWKLRRRLQLSLSF